jgi:hypothetical protein
VRLQPPPSAPLSRPTSAHLHGILKQPGKSWRRCGNVRGRSIALGRGLCHAADSTALRPIENTAFGPIRRRLATDYSIVYRLERGRARQSQAAGESRPGCGPNAMLSIASPGRHVAKRDAFYSESRPDVAKRDAIYSESRPDVGQTRRHPCTGCMWWQASFMDATHTMAGGPGADVLAAPPMRSGDEPAEASAGPAAGACAVHARVRTYRWMRGTTAHAKCVVACALGRCNMRP